MPMVIEVPFNSFLSLSVSFCVSVCVSGMILPSALSLSLSLSLFDPAAEGGAGPGVMG